jgi:putative SOS response-associated peptidase YedK
MCGRYTLTIDKSTIEHRFGAKFYIAQASYDWSPSYNAAPSQMLPITRTHKPDTIELAKWSFWPEEWKRTKRSHPMINARVENRGREANVAPSSPLPGARRQLLRVAAGRHTQTAVSHHAEHRRALCDGRHLHAQADGIRHGRKEPGHFAILTTQANDAVSYIHDRMPVILPLGCEKNWLRAKIPARTPHQRPRHPQSHRTPRTRNRCMMSTTITISLLAL